MRRKRLFRWLALGIVVVIAAYVTASELVEAYGSGAPFYGRTTNMDKWSSPWPLVAIVDAIALLMAILIVRRRLGGRP